MGIYTGKILKHAGGPWYLWEFQQSKTVEDEEGEKVSLGTGVEKYTKHLLCGLTLIMSLSLN